MRLFLLVLLLLNSCEKSDQTPYFTPVQGEPEQPSTNSTNQAVPTAADVGLPDAPGDSVKKIDLTFARALHLEGTPYDNIEGELVLKYEGPTGEFDLYRAVGDRQSVGGKARLESGMVVEISRSMVLVSQPQILTAKNDLDVIATRWDRAASRTGKEDLHPIKKGEKVQLLKAEKDGQCWMAIAADQFVAGCPIVEDFEAEGWEGGAVPIASEWWVKTAIDGARGWLPVDEVSFSWEIKQTKKKRR